MLKLGINAEPAEKKLLKAINSIDEIIAESINLKRANCLLILTALSSSIVACSSNNGNEEDSPSPTEAMCNSDSLKEDDFTPFGPKNVLFALVNYPDHVFDEQYGESYIQELVNATNMHFQENSYSDPSQPGMWINSFDVHGPYSVSENSMSGISKKEIFDALNKDKVDIRDYNAIYFFGYDGGQYYETKIIWDFEGEEECVVKPTISTGYDSGDFDFISYIVSHEYYHNWLGHAQFLDCSDTALTADYITTCTIIPYGDKTSLMGATKGNLNATHRHIIGWENDSQTQYISSNGTYIIYNRSENDPDKKIRSVIARYSETGEYLGDLSLEFIQPIGLDQGLYADSYKGLTGTLYYYDPYCVEGNNVNNWFRYSVCNLSLLVDFQPNEEYLPCYNSPWANYGLETAAEGEPCENPNRNFTLQPGMTFVDDSTGIQITTISYNIDYIIFTVLFQQFSQETPLDTSEDSRQGLDDILQ